MFLAFLSSCPLLWIPCVFHSYMFSVSFRALLVCESYIDSCSQKYFTPVPEVLLFFYVYITLSFVCYFALHALG